MKYMHNIKSIEICSWLLLKKVKRVTMITLKTHEKESET